METVQSKKHKLGTYEIDKISLLCFDDTCYMIKFITYFHKDGVTSCNEIKKDCNKKEEIKKDCIKGDCDKKDCNN